MKKIKLSNILLTVMFLAGLTIFLYPTISDYINQFSATHAIAGYVEALNQMPQEEYDRILKDAADYNRRLSHGKFVNGESKDETYQSLLNVSGTGMMGYIEIRKLKVNLPIYHGTSEKTLQQSAGHLEGSSLPIGGEGTHAVITGHRGLPTAKLFTDLDRLEEGDVFTLNIMNETLTYEVDKISIVRPEDVSLLNVIPGEDHVTLVTCTPYAVNTHRLLVRGVRIEGERTIHIPADAIQIDPLLVAPAVAAPILLVLLLYLLLGAGGSRRKRKRKKEKLESQEGLEGLESQKEQEDQEKSDRREKGGEEV